MLEEYYRTRLNESMTNAPVWARYQNMANAQSTYEGVKKERDPNRAPLIKRLFFQWDLREIEAELQLLKLSKVDLVESAFQKSEIGFFNLFFKMLPTLATATLLLLLSFILFLSLTHVNFYFAFIATFFFLQLFLFPYGRIIYGLDRNRIGEKETGRFIKIVRNVWHSYELFYLFVTGFFLYLFFHPSLLKHFQDLLYTLIEQKKLSLYWQKFLDFLQIDLLFYVVEFYGAALLFFALTYIIATFIINLRAKKESVKSRFELQKEFRYPAEIVKERFGF